MTRDERRRLYVEKQVWSVAQDLLDGNSGQGGGRNDRMNSAAVLLGHFVGGGVISFAEAESWLRSRLSGWVGQGFTQQEIDYHLSRALKQGQSSPRRWPDEIDPSRDNVRPISSARGSQWRESGAVGTGGAGAAGGGQGSALGTRDAAPAVQQDLPGSPGAASGRTCAVAGRPGESGGVGLARPPAGEVAQLWNDSLPLSADPALAQVVTHRFASAWVSSRGLSCEFVAAADLARVIPFGHPLPRWAAMGKRSWLNSGHALIVQGVGSSGQVESLHARFVGSGTAPERKAIWPSMGPGSATGLVFANGPARSLLFGDLASAWPEGAESGRELARTILIAEGVPDWLTCCQLQPDLPVFGMASGGWQETFSARVPDGTTVIVWTHADASGDKYARKINQTFAGRNVTVVRGSFETIVSGTAS